MSKQTNNQTNAQANAIKTKKNVSTYMVDGLAPIPSIIDDNSKPVCFQPKDLCQLSSRQQHVPKELLIFIASLAQTPNSLFRDQKNMVRCLWIDVTKCQTLLIFVNDISLYLPT